MSRFPRQKAHSSSNEEGGTERRKPEGNCNDPKWQGGRYGLRDIEEAEFPELSIQLDGGAEDSYGRDKFMKIHRFPGPAG